MAHVRTQLLDAIETAITGLATTGGRVYRQRPEGRPLPLGNGPALRLFIQGDATEPNGIHVPFYDRATLLRIEGVAKQTADLEATLDQIGVEVETALGPELTVGSASVRVLYRGCDFQDSAEGDQPVGVISMRFEASLLTEHGAPEVLIEQ